MRPYQKVALVVGCLWLVVVPLMFMMDYATGRDGKPLTTVAMSTSLPLLLLWWVTGTFKHIITWFKGDQK